MTPNRRDLFALTALASWSTLVRGAVPSDPATIGLDPRRLQDTFDRLEGWTRSGAIPGGAILVGRHGKLLAPRFFGKMGPEKDAAPIRADARFLMASITKPITYMAAMQLVERGKLNLSDRVVHYLPEFTGRGREAVRVRHLFTHTSGLPDMPPHNQDLRVAHSPLSKYVEAVLKDAELAFPPGSKLSYQSCGTILVAEIVQRLTGSPIADVVKKEIFDPLGLKATTFGAKGIPRELLVRVQLPDYQTDPKANWNSDYWRDLGAPWGGMFSTSDEFAIVLQMLLNGGVHNGVRILSTASVKAMTTNRLLEEADLPEAIARTQPWGLGWRLNHPGTDDSWGDLLGPSVFGHSGATGTLVWADPASTTICILLTNALRANAPGRLVHLSNTIAAAIV